MAPTKPNSYYGLRLMNSLKELRINAGLTQTEIAERMHTNLQRISRLEQGQLVNRYELLAFLDEYGVSRDEWGYYTELLEKARSVHWWSGYGLKDGALWETKMEDAAYRKEEFQLGYVPDLLQTEEYARAVLSSPGWSYTAGEVDALVEVRMRRQKRLQEDRILQFHVVMHETVIAQSLVDDTQLKHLVKVSQRGNITIQVVPFSADVHRGLRGSFSLFFFEHDEFPEAACLDSPLNRAEVRAEKSRNRLKEVFDDLQSVALSPSSTIKWLKARRQQMLGSTHQPD